MAYHGCLKSLDGFANILVGCVHIQLLSVVLNEPSNMVNLPGIFEYSAVLKKELLLPTHKSIYVQIPSCGSVFDERAALMKFFEKVDEFVSIELVGQPHLEEDSFNKICLLNPTLQIFSIDGRKLNLFRGLVYN